MPVLNKPVIRAVVAIEAAQIGAGPDRAGAVLVQIPGEILLQRADAIFGATIVDELVAIGVVAVEAAGGRAQPERARAHPRRSPGWCPG